MGEVYVSNHKINRQLQQQQTDYKQQQQTDYKQQQQQTDYKQQQQQTDHKQQQQQQIINNNNKLKPV